MAFSSVAFFFLLCLAILAFQATSSKMYNMGNDQTLFSPRNDQTLFSPRASNVDSNNPILDMFIRIENLKLGGKMSVYFPIPDNAPLLSKEQAHKLPTKLPEALEYFGFPEGSKEAEDVEKTMAQCKPSSTKGEVKFCAATLDSLLQSAKPFFGNLDDVLATSTKMMSKDSSDLLQSYTVVEEPKVVTVHKMMGCHVLPYPNLLYLCHGQESENKLFKASLVGKNGWSVEAVGICHMDTSKWSPKHPVFKKMQNSPGKGPLCHFFPAQNLIFFPSKINFD